MGYLKTIQYKGLTVTNAYHRIDTTSSADGKCSATLNNYVSRQSFLNGEGYLEQIVIEYPISYGSNVGSDKDQGYAYISSLEGNEDIEHVFEDGQPS